MDHRGSREAVSMATVFQRLLLAALNFLLFFFPLNMFCFSLFLLKPTANGANGISADVAVLRTWTKKRRSRHVSVVFSSFI